MTPQPRATNPYIRSLLDANPLREPLLRSVVQALNLPVGSRGLDVGCGIGLQAALLTDAVGVEGRVVGVDCALDLLIYAETQVTHPASAKRISFSAGDAAHLPFADDTFDWVWSADCVGYPAGDLRTVLKELMRVVKPGGSILLLGWTSQQVLPGYPLLEAWLNAECSAYRPYLDSERPDRNFLRTAYWMDQAGLQSVQARTFVEDVFAPLEAGRRTALSKLFEMLWHVPEALEAHANWREYHRLCRPESPDFILDQPGYYGFFTYTLFRGVVPGK